MKEIVSVTNKTVTKKHGFSPLKVDAQKFLSKRTSYIFL